MEVDNGTSDGQVLTDNPTLVDLAPRKVDWDLKRNIQKKLDKLEKRTQRSIVEIIRDRVKAEGNE